MLLDIKKLIKLSILSWSYILVIFLYVISSFLDIVGLGLLGVFISFFLDGQNSNSSFILNFLFVDKIDFIEPLVTIGILLLLVFFLKLIFFLVVNNLIINFSNKILKKMRFFLISKYQFLDYLEFIKKNKSEYIYNSKDLSRAFSGLVISLLKISGELIVLTFLIIFLFFQNFFVTLSLIILTFILYFIYDKIFKTKLINSGKNLNDSSDAMYKFISQTLDGFKEIRILGKENFFFNQIKENTRIWTDAFKKIFLISTMIKYFVEYIFVFIVVIFTIIIYFTGKDLNQYLPLLAIFIVAGIRLFPVTNSILNNIVQIRTGKDTIRRLYDVIEKIPNSTWNNKKNLNSDMDTNNSFKAINLDNISFKYHEQKDLIFQETSLTIKSGSIIGFIGESGSGKSTLIDIIVGLIEPIAGQIKINNLKLNENLYLVQKFISYIPQQLFIFDASIAENIALGIKKEEIDLVKLNSAIKKANLENFVISLPQKHNSIIGDGGVKISGGQRQRIGIARSFYFEKPILIFDEATNALDEQNEKEIIKNIKEMKGNKTILIISHKSELLDFCDEIYEIKNKKILKSR